MQALSGGAYFDKLRYPTHYLRLFIREVLGAHPDRLFSHSMSRADLVSPENYYAWDLSNYLREVFLNDTV